MVFSYDCLTDWALLIIKKIIYLENRLSVCFLLFLCVACTAVWKKFPDEQVGSCRDPQTKQNKWGYTRMENWIPFTLLCCKHIQGFWWEHYYPYFKRMLLRVLGFWYGRLSNKLLTINGSKNSKHIYNLFLCMSEFWGLNNHKNRTEVKSRTFKANAFFFEDPMLLKRI